MTLIKARRARNPLYLNAEYRAQVVYVTNQIIMITRSQILISYFPSTNSLQTIPLQLQTKLIRFVKIRSRITQKMRQFPMTNQAKHSRCSEYTMLGIKSQPKQVSTK